MIHNVLMHDGETHQPEYEEPIPYVGPRPFEYADRDRFFGRDQETSELLSLIIAHRAILLYAQSGAGKTSLLNARLIPCLQEEEGFEVLPLARVRGLIPDEMAPYEVPNPFVLNVLISWASYDADPRRLADRSLADFLAERPHLTDEASLALPRIIIFDQFEELFSFYLERWQDREGFFEQVSAALEADPLLRVAFSIREDYIAQLDPYTHLLPERLSTRFRLERLREDAALAAITRPVRETPRTFADGVAKALVDELMRVRVETVPGEITEVPGQFVEPVQLQVVCQSLWQSLPPDTTVITQDHIEDFGDVDHALSGFYERSIDQAARASTVSEGSLRRWFERSLITPAGTRGTVYRGREETGGIPNTAVDALQDLHLIRGEWRAGARWYELTHDRFIEPIQRSNEEWRVVRSLGIPEGKERIIDYAQRREKSEDWDGAARAYERLLELDRGAPEDEARWLSALERVEEESLLASFYADARTAIEGQRWIEASEKLFEITERRPDYKEAERLETMVWEHRITRRRRARMNAAVNIATTGLTTGVSGIWLATLLERRVDYELATYVIGGLAAISGLAFGLLFSDYDEFEIGVLNVRGDGNRHIALRFGSIALLWLISEFVVVLVGLLGWGAGALTGVIFHRFTGFYVILGAWALVCALGIWGLSDEEGVPEPADPTGGMAHV